MLTRENLKNGFLQDYVRHHDPTARVLDEHELAASIEATLASRPSGAGGLRVFGYGSLIWNPAFHFNDRVVGRIWGWHRRFCLWVRAGRGTPENPGLMLALEAGGSTRGLVYGIDDAAAEEELLIIWRREMVTAAYRPIWVTAHTDAGPVPAITFVINRRHDRYAGLLPEDRVVETCASACGALGGCAEYLFNTVEHLEEMGLPDRHLAQLRDQVAARMRQLGCAP